MKERKSMNGKRKESGCGKRGVSIRLKCTVHAGQRGRQVERAGEEESRGRTNSRPSLLSRQERALAAS